MTKLSVVEAAEVLGVSKEAIYNRIRRNTLKSVTENGLKYVFLDKEEQKEAATKPPRKPRQKQTINDERYIELLLEQIDDLKEANRKLQEDKERLISEKEELLKGSKDEVEKIYKDRDKQLKNILTIITKPLLTYMRSRNDAIDAEFEDLTPYERELVVNKDVEKWINVEEYMEEKGYSNKKKKTINTQLVAQVGFNKSLKEENGVLFIKRGKKIKEVLGKKQ